ncbi:hypothetical protein EVAR_97544_1 [Eumeta japonica]|uniref:Uncharacterized protein n=1 Tax=Eumeta variegata TaxID=151549 RepID=A0A4C1WM24_EUMVA|nr:hypothetical protein EVAR_97544_1 [Eumeta japonica]
MSNLAYYEQIQPETYSLPAQYGTKHAKHTTTGSVDNYKNKEKDKASSERAYGLRLTPPSRHRMIANSNISLIQNKCPITKEKMETALPRRLPSQIARL